MVAALLPVDRKRRFGASEIAVRSLRCGGSRRALRRGFCRGLRSALLAFAALAAAGQSGAQCLLSGAAEPVDVAAVVDGDTLLLRSGQRLRVIGANSPELGHGRAPDEPLARAARDAARRYIERHRDNGLLMQLGAERGDRYGRVLAHVFPAAGGEGLASWLVGQGLAWRVAIPPNLRYQDCLARAEASARESGRGAWSESARRAYEQQPLRGGFRLITARIVDVRFGASWWLITDAGIAARIMPTDQAAFDRAQLPHWTGAEVELRGWMYRGAVEGERGASWVMLLRDPAVLRRFD